jgi:hypothetical protein
VIRRLWLLVPGLVVAYAIGFYGRDLFEWVMSQ